MDCYIDSGDTDTMKWHKIWDLERAYGGKTMYQALFWELCLYENIIFVATLDYPHFSVEKAETEQAFA